VVYDWNVTHVDVSDVLSQAIDKNILGSAAIIKQCQERDQLVPDELMVSLMMRWMLENQSSKYLITGFPRTMVQALIF
jgi:adenylate kinase family enzyme